METVWTVVITVIVCVIFFVIIAGLIGMKEEEKTENKKSFKNSVVAASIYAVFKDQFRDRPIMKEEIERMMEMIDNEGVSFGYPKKLNELIYKHTKNCGGENGRCYFYSITGLCDLYAVVLQKSNGVNIKCDECLSM